jgi:hypothetical protein
MLSEYQAEYPAILDIATSLSLNKLLGSPDEWARLEQRPDSHGEIKEAVMQEVVTRSDKRSWWRAAQVLR